MNTRSRFAPWCGLVAVLAVLVGCSDECTCPEIESPPAPAGSVVVNPFPDLLSAGWTLSGPEEYLAIGAGDSTLADLEPGAYTIAWDDVPDWIAPTAETLDLVDGATLQFRGIYTSLEPQAVIRVALDGSGDHTTIQAAVDAALPMSTILLAPGRYQGEGNRGIHLDGKVLSIIGEEGPGATIIDCEDQARGFTVTGVPYCWIEGLTIRGGFPVTPTGYSSGGGVYVGDAHCVVENCRFIMNHGSWGGGVHCAADGFARIGGCRFTRNHAATGGAVAAHHDGRIDLHDCEFDSNWANRGGAAFAVDAFLSASSCFFRGNESRCEASGCGGAVGGERAERISLSGCVFMQNSALVSGGAVAVDGGVLSVSGCTFHLNDAPADDGCIAFRECEQIDLSKSIITGTVAGAAVVGDAALYPWCSDLHGNDGGDWVGPVAEAWIPELDNRSGDPLYCDPWQEDYALQAASPCHPDSNACGLMGAVGVGCE